MCRSERPAPASGPGCRQRTAPAGKLQDHQQLQRLVRRRVAAALSTFKWGSLPSHCSAVAICVRPPIVNAHARSSVRFGSAHAMSAGSNTK
jgi:predicted nucleic acid-binding Zn ribbon protein